jgi:gliding motility-associated-like protein
LDTIRVDAVDPGFTTVPNPVCQNALMYFKDTTSSYFTKVNSWLWTFTNGDTSTLEAPAYQYNTAGIFPISLRVADSWGCSGTVTQNVVVFPPPVITVSPDTIVCLGDAATLIGYGGVSYVWAGPSLGCTACNPAMASPLVASTYTVTGTDAHGCIGTDTATVRLKTKTVSTGHGDTSVCYGVPVQLLDSGATKFDWQPQGGLSSPTIGNPVATPKQTTDFEIIAQLGSCIPDTNYIKVTIFPIPTVNAGPDQTEPEGLPVHLHATGTNIDYYEWAQDPTLSCDTCLDPVASPGITTTYAINVTTTHGCIATDSVTIHVYCDKGQVFIPNTFTPNGDGEDDVFYPRGRGIGIIKSFRIYNRWGQLLFERHDIAINDKANAWDGTYMGATPRPDVYVWVVDAVCDSGEPINLKGDVTIIR